MAEQPIFNAWPTAVLSFASKLKQDNKLCDLVILSADETQFPVHSLILCAASPVLNNLVVTGNTTLSFPDISHDVWSTILELVYSGYVESNKYLLAEKSAYIKAADLLTLHPILQKKLEEWLHGNSTENVTEVTDTMEQRHAAEPKAVEESNDKLNFTRERIKFDDSKDIPKDPNGFNLDETNQKFCDEIKVESTEETEPDAFVRRSKRTATPTEPDGFVRRSKRTATPTEPGGFVRRSKRTATPTESGGFVRRSKRTATPKQHADYITELPNKKVKMSSVSDKVCDNLIDEMNINKKFNEDDNDNEDTKIEAEESKEIEEEIEDSKHNICANARKRNQETDSEIMMENEITVDEIKEESSVNAAIKISSIDNDKLKRKRTKSGKLRAPEAIISIMKKLEKQAKQEKIKTFKEIEESNQSAENFAIHSHVRVTCITCGCDCQAVNVKCLLCLERIEKTEMMKHIGKEHSLFKHQVFWVSCAFKSTPVQMGDYRDRIIAKQLVVTKQVEHGSIFQGTEYFKCSLCTDLQELCDLKEIRSHLKKSHSVQNVFVCMHCSDIFRNPGIKREHQHYCGGGEPFRCEVCGAVTDGHKSMWRHKKSVHENLSIESLDTEELKLDAINVASETRNDKDNVNFVSNEDSSTDITSNLITERKLYQNEITLTCISCGENCKKETISCVLCASSCPRSEFLEHIEMFHSNCPTSTYWYRCKFVFTRRSKIGEIEIDDRVVGRRFNIINPSQSEQTETKLFDSSTSNPKDKAKTTTAIEIQCALCPQVCSGISIMGKHCRFDHGIRNVMMCKYCNDVFRSMTMRDKHQFYCGEMTEGDLLKCGHCSQAFKSHNLYQNHKKNSCQPKKERFVGPEQKQLQNFLQVYCHTRNPCTIEGAVELKYGKILANPEQSSKCLKCAKNMSFCSSRKLKCFLCFQEVDAGMLDLHISDFHNYLQGTQCFACPYKKAKKQKFISYIIGFSLDLENINDSEEEGNEEDRSSNIDLQQCYTCSVCRCKSKSLEEFAQHSSKNHNVNELYSCKTCPIIFNTKLSRDDHEFFCSGNAFPYCTDCKIIFSSPSLYKKHIGSIHTGKSKFKSSALIKCPYCDSYEEFGEDRYRNHLRMIHKRTSKFYLCKTCFVAFEQYHVRDEHSFREHSEQIPLCQECGQTFETPLKLQRHITYWHRDGRLKEMQRRKDVAEKVCPHCGKGFKLSANLTDHINRYHLHFKPYKCRYCDKKFYHTFARKKHEFKDHAAGYYECSQCGHRVYSRWDLKQHEERAHGTSQAGVATSKGREKAPLMYDKIQVKGIPDDGNNHVHIQQSRVEYPYQRLDGSDATSADMEIEGVHTNWSSKDQVYFVNVNYKQPEARKIIVRTTTDEAPELIEDEDTDRTQNITIDTETQYMLQGSTSQEMVYEIQSGSGEVYQMVPTNDSIKTDYIQSQQAGEQQTIVEMKEDQDQTLVVTVEGDQQVDAWEQSQEACEVSGEEVIYVLQQ